MVDQFKRTSEKIHLYKVGTAGVFIITFLAFCSPELSLDLMNGHIDAAVNVFSFFGTNENFAVFGPGDYLNTGAATLITVYNYLHLIDTIVVLCKLGCFFFRVFSDSFRYFDVFTTDCKKQDHSP
jgi:hypothetical protein